MTEQRYKRQVNLLLKVLPEVSKEKNLALHGGTAINLFVRNMPRLSVDIDLTYIPIESRKVSLENVHQSLENISEKLSKVLPEAKIHHKQEIGKLLISNYENLSTEDKKFLMSIKNLNPVWEIHDFENFPAVRWKLQNLEKLQKSNPQKHKKQADLLQKHLETV